MSEHDSSPVWGMYVEWRKCAEQAEAEAASLRAENERLRAQSERPKCMYCTFGEDADFTVDDLKQHIENECDFHPLRKLKRELAEVSDEMTDLQVAWQQQAERAIRAEARTRALEAAGTELFDTLRLRTYGSAPVMGQTRIPTVDKALDGWAALIPHLVLLPMKARKLTAQQFVPLIKAFCEAHGMEQIKASYGWDALSTTMFKGETVWEFSDTFYDPIDGGSASPIVGWGSMHFNTRDAEEGDATLIVGVFPAFQGRGYCTQILDWMSARAKKLGATTAAPAPPPPPPPPQGDECHCGHCRYVRANEPTEGPAPGGGSGGEQ